jgi:hypothetical protein
MIEHVLWPIMVLAGLGYVALIVAVLVYCGSKPRQPASLNRWEEDPHANP